MKQLRAIQKRSLFFCFVSRPTFFFPPPYFIKGFLLIQTPSNVKMRGANSPDSWFRRAKIPDDFQFLFTTDIRTYNSTTKYLLVFPSALRACAYSLCLNKLSHSQQKQNFWSEWLLRDFKWPQKNKRQVRCATKIKKPYFLHIESESCIYRYTPSLLV